MRIRSLVLACLLGLSLLGCGVSPNAGEEIVLVMQPWFFGHGGVHPAAVTTGLAWVAPTTYGVTVNMQPQLFKVHFDDFMSKDGVPLDFDAALRLQVVSAVALVRDFGIENMTDPRASGIVFPRWYFNNVHKNFENFVRQAVRKHGMNETAISTVAISEIDEEVGRELARYITEIKLPVRFVDLAMGRANPPDAVKNQRVRTAEEQQRKLTEEQRKLAEDSRRAAELSRAAADNAYREALQLSPEQFLRLETIRMQREVCGPIKEDKKGVTHCTFVMGGGVVPTLDVKR